MLVAGTPGGTPFPMVVMGTLVGTLLALVATHAFGIPMAYALNFIAMVRAFCRSSKSARRRSSARYLFHRLS